MALKKALPGRQPGSFRESFISIECFYIVQKQKINRGTQNFWKRKVKVRETSIVEVGELLELCSCSRKLCESWLQKLFNKNNYPLVQFHCIIKIMCQGLPLECLQCLLVCTVQDRNFGCSARFYIFYWNVKRFWNFFHCIYIQIVYFS